MMNIRIKPDWNVNFSSTTAVWWNSYIRIKPDWNVNMLVIEI